MSVFLTPSVDRTSCARGDDAEGCVYEAWLKLPQPPPSMIVQTERSYLRSGPLLSGQYVCVLLNTGAVCGRIFTRCWKGRFFRPPWAVFTWGSVISRERRRGSCQITAAENWWDALPVCFEYFMCWPRSTNEHTMKPLFLALLALDQFLFY